MSNDVTTTRSNPLAALKSLKTGIASVRQRMPENTGTPYLRMGTDGEWVFGQDDNVVKPGTEAVINPLSIKHGYTCWTNRTRDEGKNENLAEEMFRLNDTVPMAHELPQHSDPKNGKPCPWKDQMSVDIKFLDGKHKGVQVLYKASSVGGLNACRGLLDAILERLDLDTEFVCPIVSFGNDSYKHKSYGKTYVPVLEIVGWTDIEGNEEGGSEDEVKAVTKQPEPEPEAEEPEAEEPEAEEVSEDTAPPRRRRRV